MCPLDCTAFVVSGKVEIPLTGLTTPVGWLSLPQLTVVRGRPFDPEGGGGTFGRNRLFIFFTGSAGKFISE